MVSIALIIIISVLIVILVIFIFWLISRSKGKIEIQLEKYQFSAGETILGTVKLNLNKPVEADSLNIGLIGEAKTKQYGRSSKGGMRSSTNYSRVFDFSQQIDGKKIYNPGEQSYNLSIKIPKDLTANRGTGNQMLDTAMKGAQMLVGGGLTTVSWYVTAYLNINGFDISKKVKINIA